MHGSAESVPPPDDAAHQDGLLMAELTQVNTLIGRYVLRFLDADAGRADPISTDDERVLADQVAEVAEALRARAERRELLRLPASNVTAEDPSTENGMTANINYSALTPYAPYITTWSEERDPPSKIIESPGRGIAYLDETVTDRDGHGVLWFRTPSRPGDGQPMFAKVHPLRQRRAMRRLLCNVCARPADQTDEGVLWLLKDHRNDWPGWPENMGVTEPPICAPCVRVASRLCPALRNGAVTVRVRRAPIAGVRGLLYRSGGIVPVPVDEVTVPYGDPRTRWLRATNLVRELHDCTIVPVEEAR